MSIAEQNGRATDVHQRRRRAPVHRVPAQQRRVRRAVCRPGRCRARGTRRTGRRLRPAPATCSACARTAHSTAVLSNATPLMMMMIMMMMMMMMMMMIMMVMMFVCWFERKILLVTKLCRQLHHWLAYEWHLIMQHLAIHLIENNNKNIHFKKPKLTHQKVNLL